MAACPDVPAIPGVVVGSVLLLVLSSNPVWGESVTIPLVLSALPHKSDNFLTTPSCNTHTLNPATIRIKKKQKKTKPTEDVCCQHDVRALAWDMIYKGVPTRVPHDSIPLQLWELRFFDYNKCRFHLIIGVTIRQLLLFLMLFSIQDWFCHHL